MGIKGTQTEKNLLKAFIGESQARNRYIYYAKQAKKDGYEQIAAIFLETAQHEEQHAKKFLRFMEGGMVETLVCFNTHSIGTTIENLISAANGENEEWTELYPEFAKTAEEEGFQKIAAAFKVISVVEAGHEARFLKLLHNVEENKVFESDEPEDWYCRKCGYIYRGKKALENCPACDHPKAYFERKANNF